MSNRSMARDEWQRRITRAEELCAQYSFAAEILRFYLAIARFQENFYGELGRSFADGRLKDRVLGGGARGLGAFCAAAPTEGWPADSANFCGWLNRTVRARFGKLRASCVTAAKMHISNC